MPILEKRTFESVMTRLQNSSLGLALLAFSACGSTSAPSVSCTVSGVSVSASANPIAPGVSSLLTASIQSSGAGCKNSVAWSQPAGSTVTQTSTTMATFSSSAVGSYVVTATSLDDASKTGPVTLVVQTGGATVALWDVAQWDATGARWQ
jgi:hypothetical protein